MGNIKPSEINEDIYELQPDEELKNKFIEATKQHIALVNKYASKLGKNFPDHDQSKLNDLLDGYCYIIKPVEERTKTENAALDLVTLIHITNSPHHPEYWTDTNLSGFTRKNPNPNGPIDATEMPDEYLIEMLCDWCSRSYECHNTPQSWFIKNNGKRWIFSNKQQHLIKDVLRTIWSDDDSNQ